MPDIVPKDPKIGDSVFIKNVGRYGESPDWVPAVVTDLVSRVQPAPGSRPDRERKETVTYGFRATVFYPQITVTNPENVYEFVKRGTTWQSKPKE